MKLTMWAAAVAALGLLAGGPAAAHGQAKKIDPPKKATSVEPQWKLGVKIEANPGGGVKILDIFPDSPASAVGLKAGMAIWRVDGMQYDDPLQFRDKVVFNSGDKIDLVFQDGEDFYQVTATLNEATVVVASGGKKIEKKVPQAAGLKKVKVADPRKKK